MHTWVAVNIATSLRDPFMGLLVLVVIDTTPIIHFPRGDLSGLPQVLSQYAFGTLLSSP